MSETHNDRLVRATELYHKLDGALAALEHANPSWAKADQRDTLRILRDRARKQNDFEREQCRQRGQII